MKATVAVDAMRSEGFAEARSQAEKALSAHLDRGLLKRSEFID
jgi:hypothetical protein